MIAQDRDKHKQRELFNCMSRDITVQSLSENRDYYIEVKEKDNIEKYVFPYLPLR